MALVTKYVLIEQIKSLLSGGSPGAGIRYEHRMIESHLQQAVNRHLKAEYFNVTLPGDETIPEGIVLASYDGIPVERYKGMSRARLPAMPISLRRNMGVFFVGPAVIDATIDLKNAMTATALSSSSGLIQWEFTNHATQYQLERDVTADFGAPQLVYTGDALSFTDTLLEASSQYFYRLRATATGYSDSEYVYADFITRSPAILDEDGGYMLAEDGSHILMEPL